MKFAFPHISNPQMHDPGWRHWHHNAVGEICIFGNNHIFMVAGIFPKWRVGKTLPKVTRMDEWQPGRKGEAVGNILVKEKSFQTTSTKLKWCFIKSEENRKHCKMSSRVSDGYSSRTSSMESPALRNSRMVCTGIRVPCKTGCPLHISGSTMMRFIYRSLPRISRITSILDLRCWSCNSIQR